MTTSRAPRILLAALLSSAAIPAAALADPNADMAKQIESMQKQIQQLQAQLEEVKKSAASAKASAKAASADANAAKQASNEAAKAASLQPAAGGKTAAATPAASDAKIVLGPGPKISTADGQYSFAVGGFAQFDAASFDDDRHDYGDGTILRRGRLNVSGVIAKDWAYKFENDFANNSSAVTDAFLQYNGLAPFSFTAGQFKEPFGMEELTSDLYVTFLERASLTAFVPDRNIGFAVATHGDNWSATVGGFGSNIGTNSTDDESHAVTARLTYAPIADKANDTFLHLGVAGTYRIPDQASDSFTFASKPLTGVTPTNAVSTGAITHVDNKEALGLEAAFVYGPFATQGEYMVTEVNRDAGFSDATFDGYYVETSYFITGEHLNYNPTTGKFDMVKVKHPLSLKDGGWGAWQIMARYGDLNLNDTSAGITGGDMKDLTLGIKWFPHERIRVVGNYARINTDSHATTANDDPSVWMLRTQFDF